MQTEIQRPTNAFSAPNHVDSLTGMNSTSLAHSGIVDSMSGAEARLIKLAKVTWKWLLLAAGISGGAAFYWASEYATTTFQVESRLVYNKTFFGAPLYQSPDVHTLMAEFQSKEAVEDLIASRGLKTPADFIARQVTSEVERGEGAITVTMDWEDQEDAIEMLDQLVDIGLQRTRMVRDQGLDHHIVGLRDSIETMYLPTVLELKEQYAKLSESSGVRDISIASEEWKRKLEILETELRAEQATHQAVAEQISRMQSPVALVASLEKQEKDFVRKAKPVSPTALVNRIDTLESEIDDQRSQLVLESRLKSKEAELQRIAPLVGRGLMSQSRLSELEAEVDELRLEARGDGSVVDMEQELERLKRQMENFGDDPDSAVEAMREASRLQVALDTQLTTSRVRIEHLESSISHLEPRIKALDAEMVQARELAKMLDMAETKLEEKMALVEGLETLKKGDAHGFRIVETAAPSMTPEKSNFRKLFASVFILGLLGLATPIIGLGTRHVMPSPAEALAERLQLSELGSFTKADLKLASSRKTAHQTSESARLTAIRLQYLSQSFSRRMIHVIGLSGRVPTIAVTKQVGAALAKMGEDVTVVVVGGTAKKDKPIVSENRSDDQPNNLRIISICESQADEILSHLHTVLPSDAEGAEGIVLLTGVSCKSRSDIELLTLKSDAIVLASPAGQRFTDAAGDVVGNLKRFSVPVLGVIS